MNTQQFISTLGPLATKDMRTSGILASITTAQAILESGWGTSELAVNANNFFGMKKSLSGNTWPNSTWDGKSIYTKVTGEQKPTGEYYEIKADFRKYPEILDSIRDHSAYLSGAMNGTHLRYAGLVGEKNYRKAIQIIKDGGYATSLTYVDKVCNLIEKYNLSKYDIIKEESDMKISKSILTKNPCYAKGRKLDNGVKGLMLHSVGCAQPKASAFINTWNSVSYDRACVHAFIDAKDGTIYQTLPWDWRGWHCGGSGNNTHIGVEMCEPDCITYTGASTFKCTDKQKAKEMVNRTYKSAVQLFAKLCKTYGLNPTKKGVIVSHKEGCAQGIASNHGDPEHLWKGVGLAYTMGTFRKAVAKAMEEDNAESTTGAPTTSSTSSKKVPYQVRVKIADLRIRTGPGTEYTWTGKYTGPGTFTITQVKGNWGRLKSGAGWISLAYCTEV